MKDKEVYKIISEEQPYCQLCGSPYNLNRHHIRYGQVGRKTYLGNIIVLCNKCHMMVHSNKRKWQPLLIKKADKHERNMGR